jgi:hypothetical protein
VAEPTSDASVSIRLDDDRRGDELSNERDEIQQADETNHHQLARYRRGAPL